ncbi:hypothetical protein DPMN_168052 [Dreissena polymorpha]|uniref:Uncharacterized protein n=1 Tax=Dreissena polymorpha TaxID=45954 RepID=A0A9D4F1B3_DREPO|nr:hypothetical protein DPMN_168052 [Dreissena polymorpha]
MIWGQFRRMKAKTFPTTLSREIYGNISHILWHCAFLPAHEQKIMQWLEKCGLSEFDGIGGMPSLSVSYPQLRESMTLESSSTVGRAFSSSITGRSLMA